MSIKNLIYVLGLTISANLLYGSGSKELRATAPSVVQGLGAGTRRGGSEDNPFRSGAFAANTLQDLRNQFNEIAAANASSQGGSKSGGTK